MSDTFTELYPSKGGDKIDQEGVTVGGVPVKRQRIQIAGAADVEIARVKNVGPSLTDYGVVTRPIPSSTPAVTATWDAGTPVPTNLVIDCLGYNTVLVHHDGASAVTIGIISIEGTEDGVNWHIARGFGNALLDVIANLIFPLSTDPNIITVVASPFTQVRLRLLSAIDASITLRMQAVEAMPEMGLVIPTQLFAVNNKTEVWGVSAHNATISGNPVVVGGRSHDTADAAPVNKVSATGRSTRILTDRDGVQLVRTTGGRPWSVVLNFAVNGNNAIKAAPAAGLSLYVTDLYFEPAGVVTPTLKEDAAGTNTTILPFQAGAIGKIWDVHMRTPIKLTAAKSLDMLLNAAVNVSGVIAGFTAE